MYELVFVTDSKDRVENYGQEYRGKGNKLKVRVDNWAKTKLVNSALAEVGLEDEKIIFIDDEELFELSRKLFLKNVSVKVNKTSRSIINLSCDTKNFHVNDRNIAMEERNKREVIKNILESEKFGKEVVDFQLDQPKATKLLLKNKKYKIEDILEMVRSEDRHFRHLNKRLIDGDMVNVTTLRLRTFKNKGTVCAGCGLKALYFLKAKQKTAGWQLNLYGEKNGMLIMFTKDHIIPKSKGGPETIWNMQPMCYECNQNKADIYEAKK